MKSLKQLREANAQMKDNLQTLYTEGADQALIDEQLQNLRMVQNQIDALTRDMEKQSKTTNPVLSPDSTPLNFASVIKAIANRERMPEDMANLDEEGRAEAKALGVTVENNPNTFHIPARALSSTQVFNTMTTDGASGGSAIPTTFEGYIDALRDATVLGQLGATILPSVQGRLSFAAEAQTAGATWLTETGEIPKSTQTMGEKTLSAKRLGVYIEVTNQLLSQTDEIFTTMIMNQMLNAAAEKMDHAGLWGGEANGPVGIGSDSSVPVLYAGQAADDTVNADGAALTRGDLINMIKTLSLNNGMTGSIGFATNAAVRAALQETPIISGSDQFVWDPNQPNSLMGYNAGVTNLVPSTLTKGGSSALSGLILGNFQDIIIGMWGGARVVVDPYTLSRTGKTAMVINHYIDVMVRRPESFVVIKDIVA